MYVIGTAGHVDHGKSLLVEVLTGIDPDRLREEKVRGMTIDLGFAWLTLPSGRTVSIVDVPGHERFIKNMLAGAGGIDLALLVVAADDGVMPQTREHLAIIDLLGVARGVVALSKRDLADDAWAALVAGEIAETLRGTTLEGSPIVACSARTGASLDDLKRLLDDAIDGLAPKRDIGRPRLPIDRVFTIGGFGTVVTGTLIDGELSVGEEVEVVPGGARARIRGLQTHKDKVERALPGTRTAVNLAGIERDALRRGMVLARPGDLQPTAVLDARVRALRGLGHPLRHNTHLSFHCGSDEANAQLRLLDADELRAGAEAWAQIKLESEVAVRRGDRFVLRTPDDTVAGGTIVDVAPKRHRRRHAPTLLALEAMTGDDPRSALLDAIARAPLSDAAALLRAVGDSETASSVLDELAAAGAVVRLSDGAEARYGTQSWIRDARERLVAAIAEYHRQHPLRTGMPLVDVRALLRLDAGGTAALLQATPDVRVEGATVARAGFAPSPSEAQRREMDDFLAAIRLVPGSPTPIAPELLSFLKASRAIVDADGMLFEATSFAAFRVQVEDHMARSGGITLAQARDLLGTNRRIAQAVLEHLDRLRVTRRVGEERVLR